VRIRRTRRDARRRVPAGYGTAADTRIPYVYPNIYGNGLEVTLLGHDTRIDAGKNFNIFRSPAPESNRSAEEVSTGVYDYYLQTFPSPHRYRRLNIPDGQEDVAARLDLRIEGEGYRISPGELPRPSFDTPDSYNSIERYAYTAERHMLPDGPRNGTAAIETVPFFGDENDHGSACCVGLKLLGRDVLVGIAHQKLSPRTAFWRADIKGRYDHFLHDQFVSRFIAYDTMPPFDVVARSGWFCLGFADEGESKKDDGTCSSLAGMNTNGGNTQLNLFNRTFACPAIHFISAFTDVVGPDDSKAIIGYGVNDCHPRMFMVEKDEIAKLLVG